MTFPDICISSVEPGPLPARLGLIARIASSVRRWLARRVSP